MGAYPARHCRWLRSADAAQRRDRTLTISSFNPRLRDLQPYPFVRLRQLMQGAEPPPSLPIISLAVGEPKGSPPAFVLETLRRHEHLLNSYPTMAGCEELRTAIAAHLSRRFGIASQLLDPDRHIVPVAGTREGLFSLLQTLAQPGKTLVLANPFYQLFAGAAVLGGMRTHLLPGVSGEALRQTPAEVWDDCAVMVLCSPHNPTGAALQMDDLKLAVELADRHDFALVSDECYTDIYLDEAHPPAGLLQCCAALGRDDFARCVSLQSLSKRSSLAGLRSGFAAGDAGIMAAYLRYRDYHGCSLSLPVQHASAAAWSDDKHVAAGRARYRERFAAFGQAAGNHFSSPLPAGSFYHWWQVPGGDDEAFTLRLYEQCGLRVVPGSYLAQQDDRGENPGRGYVRMALVDEPKLCAEAGRRIGSLLQELAVQE